MKLLLDVKANFEAEDKEYGRTPLSWAAENGHTEVVKLLLDVKANFEAKVRMGGRHVRYWVASQPFYGSGSRDSRYT